MVKKYLARFKSSLRLVIHSILHPRSNSLAMAVAVLVLVGVAFYTWQEDWSIADSLYFSIVALTTIGFGDFTPTTTTTRMFTIVYALTGIGILGIAINTIVANQQKRAQRREAQSATDVHDATSNTAQITEDRSEISTLPVTEIEVRLTQLEREIGLLRDMSPSIESEIRTHIVQQSSEIASISQQLQVLANDLKAQAAGHSYADANESKNS